MVSRSTPASYTAAPGLFRGCRQEKLSAERATRSLGGDQLGGLSVVDRAFGLNLQQVALEVQVNVLGPYSRKVELHDEQVPSRQASIGMTTGRVVVPDTCSLRGSSP